MTFLNKDSAF